jgi:hypothetical protein
MGYDGVINKFNYLQNSLNFIASYAIETTVNSYIYSNVDQMEVDTDWNKIYIIYN